MTVRAQCFADVISQCVEGSLNMSVNVFIYALATMLGDISQWRNILCVFGKDYYAFPVSYCFILNLNQMKDAKWHVRLREMQLGGLSVCIFGSVCECFVRGSVCWVWYWVCAMIYPQFELWLVLVSIQWLPVNPSRIPVSPSEGRLYVGWRGDVFVASLWRHIEDSVPPHPTLSARTGLHHTCAYPSLSHVLICTDISCLTPTGDRGEIMKLLSFMLHVRTLQYLSSCQTPMFMLSGTGSGE